MAGLAIGRSVMAKQEHLDILKQGVKAWNEWRKQTVR